MSESLNCEQDECSLQSFADLDTCALHSTKSDYGTDWNTPGLLHQFNQDLIAHIAQELDRYDSENIDQNELITFLSGSRRVDDEHLESYLASATCVLSNIKFPCRDNRDQFDYEKVLKKLGKIHFNRCEFTVSSLALERIDCFFQDCVFHDQWYLRDLPTLGNAYDVLYQNCTFDGRVTGYPSDSDRLTLKSSQFHHCEFMQELAIGSADLKKLLFVGEPSAPNSLSDVEIEDCSFAERLVLNEFHISKLRITKTKFESKLELKGATISDLSIFDCNFTGIFDAHGLKACELNIEKCIFEDFVGFEQCHFGTNEIDSCPATFRHTTFLGFVNFRDANFLSGLDIQYINSTATPNFLNATINPAKTNRETFRIVKHSFDRLGNQLEGNKAFALEMKKYGEELRNSGWTQERLIFQLNEWISDFGQSYLRPIGWIFFTSLLYSALIIGHEVNLLYRIHPEWNDYISLVSDLFNELSANIIPFQRLLREGMEFLSLVFYVLISSLVWQTIVAVKRHTKR